VEFAHLDSDDVGRSRLIRAGAARPGEDGCCARAFAV
jgi:hypothetical protein